MRLQVRDNDTDSDNHNDHYYYNSRARDATKPISSASVRAQRRK